MYGLELMQGDGYKLKINSLLYDLLYLLYRDFRIELPRNEFLKHTKNLSILSKIMKYSEINHSSDISLDEIAREAGFQTKYFCRFFKNNVGCTYLFYLNQLRIQYIYQDLLNTDTPIYQLLEKHGFTNYKLFRKMFYDRFHTTPRNIRKNE
jgi:YesN/AraC family two-component response regulator